MNHLPCFKVAEFGFGLAGNLLYRDGFFAFWKSAFFIYSCLDFSGLSHNLNKDTMSAVSFDWPQCVPVFPC